jgi:hypothetical protein
MHAKFVPENLKGRDHLEEPSVDGRMILELILGKQGGKVWTGLVMEVLSLGGKAAGA